MLKGIGSTLFGLITLFLFVCTLSAQSAATVSRNANLRAGPGTSYAIVGSAKAGATVVISGTNTAGDWYQLDTGEWIAAFLIETSELITPTTTITPTATIPATVAVTKTKTVNATPTRTPRPTHTSTPVPTATTPVADLFQSGGLGLTRAEFEKRHTKTGKDIMGTIYDNDLIVSFINDRIWYIEQDFSTGISPTEAKAMGALLIPSDNVQVETYSPDGRPETTVNLYTSKSLEKYFDKWVGGDPGNFTIQYNAYDGIVKRLIVAIGNNP